MVSRQDWQNQQSTRSKLHGVLLRLKSCAQWSMLREGWVQMLAILKGSQEMRLSSSSESPILLTGQQARIILQATTISSSQMSGQAWRQTTSRALWRLGQASRQCLRRGRCSWGRGRPLWRYYRSVSQGESSQVWSRCNLPYLYATCSRQSPIFPTEYCSQPTCSSNMFSARLTTDSEKQSYSEKTVESSKGCPSPREKPSEEWQNDSEGYCWDGWVGGVWREGEFSLLL